MSRPIRIGHTAFAILSAMLDGEEWSVADLQERIAAGRLDPSVRRLTGRGLLAVSGEHYTGKRGRPAILYQITPLGRYEQGLRTLEVRVVLRDPPSERSSPPVRPPPVAVVSEPVAARRGSLSALQRRG